MRRLAALLAFVFVISCTGTALAGDVSARIVGDNTAPALADDWPFMTVVESAAGSCGGSVIARRWVLTAGHCTVTDDGTAVDVIDAYPGSYYYSTPGPRMRADSVERHPLFALVGPSLIPQWDFALVRLPSSTTATPIALPAPDESTELAAVHVASPSGSRRGQIAGWGSTGTGGSGPFPDALQYAALGVPILVNSGCSAYGANFQGDIMICAGGFPTSPTTAADDTCRGDSGGPLAVQLTRAKVVYGLTSWGALPCGDPTSPGVYARVPVGRDWICDTVTSPTSITAAAGAGSAVVSWTPDTTCPWQDATVQVTASPGGASATATVSAGSATVSGLSAGTRYTLSARVVSAAGATPPAATTTVSLAAPDPEPPAPSPTPCAQTFFQQAPRTSSSATAPDGTAALKVLSRIRVYQDAESWCRTDLTFIFRNKKTGARLSQLPGSTLGFRRLTGKDFSAPVVSWPKDREFRFAGSDPTGLGRKDARLVLQSYLPKGKGTPAMSNVELLIVRRVPANTREAPSGANPLFAQKNVFGAAAGWATVS